MALSWPDPPSDPQRSALVAHCVYRASRPEHHWTPEHRAWCEHLRAHRCLSDLHERCLTYRPLPRAIEVLPPRGDAA